MSKVLVFTDYGGPEHQELIEREVPEPGPGEIVIQVMAAGVNPADAKMRQGLFGTKRTLPSPMGLEASGIVTAVGEGVEAFAVGNEVLGSPAKGQGTFAEHAVLNAAKTVAKPEEISFVDAAAIPVAGTAAYDVTHQVELEPGQSLLILGAGGGVGLMAAQIGTVHQYRVIGVASASKRELVESTGATFVESGDGAAAGCARSPRRAWTWWSTWSADRRCGTSRPWRRIPRTSSPPPTRPPRKSSAEPA